jgi:dCMP deaminase
MEPDYSNPKAFNVVARPSWDEYFMMAAKLAGTRATCLQRKVGTVIVKDRRIIATGFNGSPPGLPHCTDVGCLMFPDRGTSCQRVIHSEHNAVLQDSGNLERATLYTSFLPCLNCMKVIISAKIKEVVYEEEKAEKDEYESAKKDFAKATNLVLRQIPVVNIVEMLSRYYPRTST